MNSGFSCVARADARILILGSMPGVASLQAAQYYAHPRNSFWIIMQHLFEIPLTLPYPARLALLKDNKIALWDVIQRCRRQGSLDANIDSDSVIINDFAALFRRCPSIQHIFFNGCKARQLFMRHALPLLSPFSAELCCHLLPSTSPAHAALSLDGKIKAWSVVPDTLKKNGATPQHCPA